jgi:hypothetical protein
VSNDGDSHDVRAVIRDRHAAAVAAGPPVYSDPVSGLSVFTARFLERRGYCCESGCRHCPYGENTSTPA